MAGLSGLEPGIIWENFEKLCGIPHGSYNIDDISDMLRTFAENEGFDCVQDEEKNILVRVPASAGREDEETLILQGHMDMVAVHDDPEVDMKGHAIKVTHDDEWVFAEGSSLGGDDGIAVAMMMAIMQDKSLSHPPLELLITTNEEVGMEGAVGFDVSLLKGKTLINLDSEDEGIFTCGCAGGVRVVSSLNLESTAAGKGCFKKIEISGLQGGHSGQMIHLGRANANKLCGRILYELNRECGACLVSVAGGSAANAIPASAEMEVFIPEGSRDEAEKILERLYKELKHEYHGKDDGLRIETSIGTESGKIFSAASTKKAAGFLIAVPDGVQAMSGVVPGLTETSLNLGILGVSEDKLRAHFELRSMIGSAALALKDRMVAVSEAFGAECEVSKSYPEWEYREDSPLRDKMIKVFERMYGKKPVVEVIHAGLECGLLARRIEGFDAVSIGPDMCDIHTTGEKLSVKSAAAVWDYLRELLKD